MQPYVYTHQTGQFINSERRYSVQCNCGASGPIRDTPAEAVAAWNAVCRAVEVANALVIAKVPVEVAGASVAAKGILAMCEILESGVDGDFVCVCGHWPDQHMDGCPWLSAKEWARRVLEGE